MTTPRPLVALLLATPLARAAPAQAIPASQHGSVTQRVGSTDIAITYNRPEGVYVYVPEGRDAKSLS